MSYVLNALRRADAERGRGTVPDLHAPPLPSAHGEAPAARRSRSPWPWLVAVLAGAVLIGGWWLLRADVPAPAPTPAPVAAAAAPRPAPEPAPALIRIEAPPPAAAPPARSPKPTRATADAESAPPLPDAVRKQLPALAFGGAMDSAQAGSRMLIVNGQVYREGESPAPGLVLERIRLRSATVRYGGQRFDMPYE